LLFSVIGGGAQKAHNDRTEDWRRRIASSTAPEVDFYSMHLICSHPHIPQHKELS
jgi:hypothetical protein